MHSPTATVAHVIGEQSLKLLREASKFVPVPGLSLAASVALQILQVAVTAEENRDGFVGIGKDACVIMVTIVQRVNRSVTGNAPAMNITDLQRDADSLLAEMEMIEKIVRKYAKRRFLKRMVFSYEESNAVQQCQGRLDHALKLFGLQSDIELRQQMALLHDKMDKVSEKLDQVPRMPEPFVQSNPSAQSLPSNWTEQSTPLYYSPSPQPAAQSHPQLIQTPTVSPAPSPQPDLTREERRAARRARKAQESIGLLGAPPDSTFNNLQDQLSPTGSVAYSYVNGNSINNSRDDSFNVSGSGNSISISFTR